MTHSEKRENILIFLHNLAYPNLPKADRLTLFGKTPLYALAEKNAGGYNRTVIYLSQRIVKIYEYELQQLKESY